MPAERGATVYVWSRRQVTKAWASDPSLTALPSREGRAADYSDVRGHSYAYGAGEGTHEYETQLALPEDQRAALAMVQRIASQRGIPIEIVDLGELRHLGHRRAARKRGWTNFPVLVGASGEILKGSGAFSDPAVTRTLTDGLPGRG